MGELILVGIKSLFFKTLYFLPFGINSSSLSISCVDGFLLGIIVSKSIKSFSSSPKSIKSFSSTPKSIKSFSSTPKSIKSFSKFSVRSNSSCGLWGLSVIANSFGVLLGLLTLYLLSYILYIYKLHYLFLLLLCKFLQVDYC